MSQTIFIVIIAVMFLIITITWIPWRDLFEKLYGNNPLRAKVYVEAGEQITFCNGSYMGSTETGVLYEYKYKTVKYTVYVPCEYPYKYILGRRQIRVILGHADASPLAGESETQINISGDLLDLILRARVGAEIVSAIFGKAINYMMIAIFVGILIFGGYFIYKNVLNKDTGQTPPTQSQNIPPPSDIEDMLKDEGAIK